MVYIYMYSNSFNQMLADENDDNNNDDNAEII